MADLQKLQETLTDLIRPSSPPLGVKLLKEGEELPPKTRLPKQDFKMRFAICQANALARRYGWVLALGKEDQSCPIGSVVLGLREAVDFYTQGNLAHGMYCASLEAGARSEAAVPRLAYGEYARLLVGPLARLSVEPDFVLVYGNAAQVMRLVHGALYHEGGAITSSFTGRGECGEIIVNTIKSGACQVILPGNGERVFGYTQDDEMAFTIPIQLVDRVTEGLIGTHKVGIRYPIPNSLIYEAKFPPKYGELEKIWQEMEGEN
ncbi:MAG: DUF169 domain-containing protein [Bacillota bacterium]